MFLKGYLNLKLHRLLYPQDKLRRNLRNVYIRNSFGVFSSYYYIFSPSLTYSDGSLTEGRSEMNKLEAIKHLLAIEDGSAGSLWQRVEKLLKLQEELEFFKKREWLPEAYQVKENANGEWICVADSGTVRPLTEDILSRMCQEVLVNIKHRNMALEWINDKEAWYYFVDEGQYVSVWFPSDFGFAVVKIGTEVKGDGHLQWELVRNPSFVKYFKRLAMKDAIYRPNLI